MRRQPQVWIGFVVSALALFLAFRGVEWSQLGDAWRGAQYGYLIPSAVSLLAAMAIRAERWRWLFGDRRHNLSTSRTFSVISIGYLITNTLPLRLGEVARPIFVARDGRVTVAHAASTIVVEHVLDVLTVLGILVLLLPVLPLPDWAGRGALASAWIFGAALAAMLLMVWQRVRVERWAEHILDRIPRLHTPTWLRHVVHVLDGFAVLQPGKSLVAAIGWSVAGWLCSAVTFHLALLAFVPNPGFMISLFVTVTTTFSLLLPATPGGIGVLQGAIVLSLAVFGIPQATALSFAIVFHLMELIVMDVVGAIMLWREAGSWASMKAQIRSVTFSAVEDR
ncbi:MAG TPA: lysylphosphatidylglycerol synthase transmembrane domain-containing protein [Anaerolineae bacterium]|nr:lysylphosphatidylglycerol synthase transmembrane domain-containing protein [Anaerolineae bacterium]